MTTVLAMENSSVETASLVASLSLEKPSEDFPILVEDRYVDLTLSVDMPLLNLMFSVVSPSVTTVLGVENSSEDTSSVESPAIDRPSDDFPLSEEDWAVDLTLSVDIPSVDSPSVTTVLKLEKPSEEMKSMVESLVVERPSDDFLFTVEDVVVDFMLLVDIISSVFMLSVDSPSLTTVLGGETPLKGMRAFVDSLAVEGPSDDSTLSVNSPTVDFKFPVDLMLSVDSPFMMTVLVVGEPSVETTSLVYSLVVERPADDFPLSVEDWAVDFTLSVDITSLDFMFSVVSPSVTTVV